MNSMPTTYEAWKRCITIDCGIPLSAEYCSMRLGALQNTDDAHTHSFTKKYGDEHLRRVTGWFTEALGELARAG